ncbi:MAG: ATP-dependent helicase, partial [Candidatus Neomarinimicrobiota bacterium]
MPSPTGTEHLTKDQRRAVTLPPGPLMILAGAGTGKTTTILHRVLVQVKRGNFSPRHTVILTFTDKATRDLSNKLVQLDPVIGDQVTIQTFHGFCYALVAELEPELHRRLTLIEEGEQIYLLARHIPEMTFLTSRAFREDPLSALQARCIPFFNRVRDELLSVDDLQSLWQQIDPDTFDPAHWLPTLSPRIEREEAWNQLQDLVQLYTRYQDWKREEGVLDYGDMIMECWSLLRRDPVRLSRVRDLYRHFIVDEYQDNNVALNEILKLLVPPRNDITVVGDQDQCIYSFRGANYQTIRDFQDTFLQGNRERLVLLEANFRSTQEILNLANQLMRQDPHRVEKNLYSGTDKTGRRPVWIPWSSRQFEDRLPSLLQQVRQEGYDWADMAILVRGGDQVRRVTRILRGAGIPADSFVEQFFQVPVIRDLVAWCEVLTDGPRFGPALGRVVSRYDGEAAPDGFWKQMTTLDALHRGLEDLADWFPEFVDHFRKLEERLHKHLTPREMLWSILEITDLLGPARRRYDALDRLNLINAGHLIAMADQFSTRLDQVTFRDWGLFLSTLAVQSNRPAQEPERMNHGSAVQVMTIHRSKGLQFPVVVLPYLVANSFPRNFTPDPGVQCLPEPWYRWPRQEGVTPRDEHLNEERRVFYVGITRAMETLYLI